MVNVIYNIFNYLILFDIYIYDKYIIPMTFTMKIIK